MDLLDAVLGQRGAGLDGRGFHAVHYAAARGNAEALLVQLAGGEPAAPAPADAGSKRPRAPPTPDPSTGAHSPGGSAHSGDFVRGLSPRSSDEGSGMASPPGFVEAGLSPSSPVTLDAHLDGYLSEMLSSGELAAVQPGGGSPKVALRRPSFTEIDVDTLLDAGILEGGGGDGMDVSAADLEAELAPTGLQPPGAPWMSLGPAAVLNLRDGTGTTPVSWACRAGSREALLLLITRGADVNLANQRGQTPLHFLCLAEPVQPSLMRTVLSQGGVDPDARDADGRTPLAYCVTQGQHGGAKALLEHGANPSHLDAYGTSPLVQAVQNADLEMLHLLIPAPGATLEARDAKGWSMLHWAAAIAEPRCLSFLLGLVVLRTDWTCEMGDTCLHVAARQGNGEAARAVVEATPAAGRRGLLERLNDDALTAEGVAEAEGQLATAELIRGLAAALPPPGPDILDPALFATKEDRARARRKEYMRRKRAEAKETMQAAKDSVARLQAEQAQLDRELQAARAEYAQLHAAAGSTSF